LANGHGGARPGAGRKSTKTQARQFKMREVLERVVSEAEWESMVEAMVEEVIVERNVAAFRELAPWIVGRVPDETHVQLEAVAQIYLPERRKRAEAE
jgi:hypothetical protein